jgi:Porin subfamily
MKMVKSLLLGGAAGLAALAGAQAADQPVPAKVATEYVKVCTGHGVGYYYVPGTGICVRIGGYVREDVYVNAVGVFNPAISSVAGTIFRGPGSGIGGYPYHTTDSALYMSRTRVISEVDARYATDYGNARTYIRAGAQYDSQSSAGGTPGVLPYIERAFLEFAGFTADDSASDTKTEPRHHVGQRRRQDDLRKDLDGGESSYLRPGDPFRDRRKRWSRSTRHADADERSLNLLESFWLFCDDNK